MDKTQLQKLNYLYNKLSKIIDKDTMKIVNDIVEISIEAEQSCNQ